MTDFSPAHAALIESVTAGAGSRLVEETVRYDHDGTPLEGFLAHDEAIDQRKPVVLIVHDWTGLREYPKARAHMLARLGWLAFAVDVYGAGVRPADQEAAEAEAGKYYGDLDLLRARVRAGYDLVAADPRVDPSRIAVIGYCFGGSAALEFARSGAELVATASFHGILTTHEPADVAAIRGSVLVATGGDDPLVPDDAIAAFQDELRTAPELDWQVSTYSGAPHAFTLPELPSWRPVADARSWRELTALLDEAFGAPTEGAA